MFLRRSSTTWALTAFLLFAVTGLLAACGGASTTASSPTSTSTGTPTTATPAARPRAITGTIDSYDAS
ncbi:MAG: hypothetical protein JOZ18_11370, partial [Chloroflexi bacterium]|nr:hypothetical protein [Chloroflexota bacterium]